MTERQEIPINEALIDILAKYDYKGISATSLIQNMVEFGFSRLESQQALHRGLDRGTIRLGAGMKFYRT